MDGDSAGYDGGEGHGGFDALPGLTHTMHTHDAGRRSAKDANGTDSCKPGFEFGYLTEALSIMGCCPGDACPTDVDANNVRRVRLPGVMNVGRTWQALIYPHGSCEAPGILRMVAARHGLVDITLGAKDLNPEDKVHENTLKDTTPFDGKDHNSKMPSGWYPGAKGYTRTFQQYWQIPKKRWPWSTPAADLEDKTYLVMSGATWHFAQTGDCETRLAVSVYSLPYSRSGIWKERTELIAAHLERAKLVADDFFAAIKSVSPSEAALMMRRIQSAAEKRALLEARTIRASVAPVVSNDEPTADHAGPGPRKRGSGVPGNDPITSFDMNASR